MTEDGFIESKKSRDVNKKASQIQRRKYRSTFDTLVWPVKVSRYASLAKEKYTKNNPKTATESEGDFLTRVNISVKKALLKLEAKREAEFTSYVHEMVLIGSSVAESPKLLKEEKKTLRAFTVSKTDIDEDDNPFSLLEEE